MTIFLQVDEEYTAQVDQKKLENAAASVLDQYYSGDPADFSLVITGTAQIRQLHAQFLGEDTPTDVLSFPSDEIDPDSGVLYLGDIIISFPQASAQAAEGGHATHAELELLAVHGALHLLGYDHAAPEEQAEMWAAQKAVLQSIRNPLESSF